MIASFLTFTLALLATAGALASLKPTRAWLKEKRERRSAKRVFRWYRKFLPKERIELRRKLLEDNLAEGALAWDPEIGVVLARRPNDLEREMRFAHFQRPALRPIRDRSSAFAPVLVRHEDFRFFELRTPSPYGAWYRLWALLIDEADEAGLKALCQKTDEAVDLHLQKYGRYSLEERLPCPNLLDDVTYIVERGPCAHGCWWCRACLWVDGLPREVLLSGLPYVLLRNVLVREEETT